MDKRWIMGLSLIVLLLAACTMPEENLPPQGQPGALYTEAAQTVSVNFSAEKLRA